MKVVMNKNRTVEKNKKINLIKNKNMKIWLMRKKYNAKKNVYVNKNHEPWTCKKDLEHEPNKNKAMKCKKRSWTQPTRTRSKDKVKKAYHKSDMWEEEK